MMAAQGITMSTLAVPNSQSANVLQSAASAGSPNASSTSSGASASSATTPSNPSSATTSPTLNQKSKSRMLKLLDVAWQYKWQGLLGLVVSIVALRYAIRADALARWTGKKDFREACFAGMDRNITSPDCLVAISGVLPLPPVRKRDVDVHEKHWHTDLLWELFQAAWTCTVFLLVKNRLFAGWSFDFEKLIPRVLHRHLHRKVPQGPRILDPPSFDAPEPVTREAEDKPAVLIDNPGLRLRKGNMGRTTQVLFSAVRGRNYGQVKSLLSSGVDPNAEFGNGTQNILLEAVHTNNYPIIQLLLDHGADPKLEIRNKPILHLAMSESNVIGVEHLINAGADPNTTSGEYLETSLHIACRNGWPDLVRLLINKGANVNARSLRGGGQTPVHAALEGASHAVFDILKQAGADFEAEDDFGGTPLHYLSRRSAHELYSIRERFSFGNFSVQDFLVYKQSLDTRNHDGMTPLHIATILGSSETAGTLIKNGADIEVTDTSGRTALHLAAKAGSREIAILLVEAGANVEAKTRAGQTPLILAACHSNWNLVLYLVSEGALVTPANDSERDDLATCVSEMLVAPMPDCPLAAYLGIALLNAAKEGRFQEVQKLLERGADIETKDQHGQTALVQAVRSGKSDWIRTALILLENGAKVSTSMNKTAF